MSWLEFFTRVLMYWAESWNRVLKITGTAGANDVYLIRYYIVRSKYFNFFVHQFLRSDRDDLHDHPWDFCTYLVRGSYTERKWNPKTNLIESTDRINIIQGHHKVRQNALIFRKATDQHQVVLDKELKEDEKDSATLTLCFTGRTKREWGFVKETGRVELNGKLFRQPTRTWIPWRKYLNLPEDAPGRG